MLEGTSWNLVKYEMHVLHMKLKIFTAQCDMVKIEITKESDDAGENKEP